MSFLIMGRGISPGLFAAPHMSPVGTFLPFAALPLVSKVPILLQKTVSGGGEQ